MITGFVVIELEVTATGAAVVFAKNAGLLRAFFVHTTTRPSWTFAGRTTLISVLLHEMYELEVSL